MSLRSSLTLCSLEREGSPTQALDGEEVHRVAHSHDTEEKEKIRSEEERSQAFHNYRVNWR